MRERLTKRNEDGSVGIPRMQYYNYDDFQRLAKKLADYEDKEERGEMILLPCKVGDMVYQVTRDFISEFKVRFVEISICDNLFLHTDLISGIVFIGEVLPISEIGKTVFLTREEAERALKDGADNGL